MNWTTEKPKEPGYYWVYVKPEWEDEYQVMCVSLYIVNGEVHFDIPCDGMEREETIRPENVTYWAGPLQEPEKP